MEDSPKTICIPAKEGWEFRFFGNEPRLSEVVEMYRDLGFETLTVKASSESCDGCTECFVDQTNPVMIVYTRRAE